MEKNSEKKILFFYKKKSPYLLNEPRILNVFFFLFRYRNVIHWEIKGV